MSECLRGGRPDDHAFTMGRGIGIYKEEVSRDSLSATRDSWERGTPSTRPSPASASCGPLALVAALAGERSHAIPPRDPTPAPSRRGRRRQRLVDPRRLSPGFRRSRRSSVPQAGHPEVALVLRHRETEPVGTNAQGSRDASPIVRRDDEARRPRCHRDGPGPMASVSMQPGDKDRPAVPSRSGTATGRHAQWGQNTDVGRRSYCSRGGRNRRSLRTGCRGRGDRACGGFDGTARNARRHREPVAAELVRERAPGARGRPPRLTGARYAAPTRRTAGPPAGARTRDLRGRR